MAFIIDTINGSGLYAQSAASASIATYDSNGNEITATYLTGVDLTPYQTTAGMTAYATTGDVSGTEWNDCYETVQTNSASWAGGGTVESYDLSAGANIQINKDDVNSAIGIAVTGLNKYQTTAGMTGYLTTGQYETDSAVFNAKQDALTFGYDTNDAISSINNSAITQPPSQKLYLQSPLTTGVSAGSAYIGIAPSAMYNETVLWSGLLNSNNATANLSESITHFKYVQVEGYTHNGVEFPWVTKLPVNGNNAIYGVGLNQWKEVTKELDMSRFKVSGTVITCMEATWIIPSNSWGSTTSNITKVIGINRISGSNT